MIGKCLHDQRTFCPFRIGVQAFDFGKVECRVLRTATIDLIFTTLENLFGGICLKRNFLRVEEVLGCANTIISGAKRSIHIKMCDRA